MITSNGTGGGVSSATTSWLGGVVPTEGVDVQILSGDTITLDTTHIWGSDSGTPALDVLSGGTLSWDGLGVDVLTCKGDFKARSGCHLTLSGVGDATKSLTVKLNYSAALATAKYNAFFIAGSTVSITGFNRVRTWDTLSATAVAGSAAVVTTNDNSANWTVGDTVVVGSLTRQGVTGAESRTIASFAGTTINLNGGNFSYNHEAGLAIINLNRNIVFTSYNTSFPGYISSAITVDANLTVSWARFTYLGTSTYALTGFYILGGNVNYCSFDHNAAGLAYEKAGAVATVTFSYLVSYANTAAGICSSAPCQYCVMLGDSNGSNSYYCGHGGLYFTAFSNSQVGNCSIGITVNRGLKFVSDMVYSCSGNGGVDIGNGGGAIFETCLFDNNAVGAIYRAGFKTTITDCSFGVTTANVHDIYSSTAGSSGTVIGVNVLPNFTGVNGNSNPATLWNVKTTALAHKSFGAFGTYEKSAAVPRTGTYSLLMSPTNASNQLIAESTVPAATGVQVVVTAYFRKNAAYGSAALPFLRLSGAGVTPSTSTMIDVDNVWQLLVVSGTPTELGFCKVELVAQSAGAGAAVYVDDVKMVYTAIDTGSFDYFYQGDLPPIFLSTGLGAADVWAVTTAQADTAGSIGALIADIPTDNVSALLDEIDAIETGLTLRQALRLIAAACAGKVSGAGTTTVSIRNAVVGGTDRIVATVDANGNRTAIAYDLT